MTVAEDAWLDDAESFDHAVGPVVAPAAPAESDALTGLTHAEVLKLELPDIPYLIDGLVPVGAVGTIAGVPETHKSWLAQAIAVRVAGGEGEILGCTVTRAGRVGYLWQDDSTAAEAQRVKDFERVHPAPAELALWWYLNAGLELPRDVPRIADAVRTNQLDLLVIDSFYNFLAGADLKAEDAERVVALLKREIADATGCTVLLVDHMPWATETNRGRLRAYGGVFKNAATRFGIYIDAKDDKLWIEARGNNIRGFKKHLAYWDHDHLELRLTADVDSEKIERDAQTVLAFLLANPTTHSTTQVRAGSHLGNAADKALEHLEATDRVKDLAERDATGSIRVGKGHRWIAAEHASSITNTLSLLQQTGSDSPPAERQDDDPVSSLYRETGFSDSPVSDDDGDNT